jgi:hypothetical protein
MCRLEAEVSISDDNDQAVLIQTLSDARFIQILQHHDFDDDITRMVEAEIARQKKVRRGAVTEDNRPEAYSTPGVG